MQDKAPKTPEPLELKRFLRGILEASGERGKYIVFTGNRLPKYLWEQWSIELKKKGFSWQDLLKALSRSSDKVIEWLEDELEWSSLIEEIWKNLEDSNPRKPVSRRRREKKTRSLEEFFS